MSDAKQYLNEQTEKTLEIPKKSGKVSFTVKAGNFQDQGKRSEQQDSFGCSDFQDEALVEVGGYTGVVCDGMGGLVGGREASAEAVKAFLEKQKESALAGVLPDAALLEAVKNANNAVVNLADGMNQLGNCGSTLVAVTVHNETLYWISVGDSHIYLLRDKQLTQLNKEHIYANKLALAVEKGLITKEDALHDPQREALTSFIGIENLIEIDHGSMPIRAGDSVLLCSDGLYKTLSHNEIEKQSNSNPQEWTERLILATLDKQNPHQDNVTAVAISITGSQKIPNKDDRHNTVQVSESEKKRKRNKMVVFGIIMLVAAIALVCADLYFRKYPHGYSRPKDRGNQETVQTAGSASNDNSARSQDNKEAPTETGEQVSSSDIKLTAPNGKSQSLDVSSDDAVDEHK